MKNLTVVDKLIERPEGVNRIHFSCNGSILLIHQIPLKVFKDGDTASGSDEEDDGMYLWRCKIHSIGTEWENTEVWSQQGAAKYLQKADLIVVLGYTEELEIAALKWRLEN